MRRISFLALCLCLGLSLHAQITRTFHQAFELPPEILSVSVELPGEVVFEPWNSNTILVETNLKIYDASKNIVQHFVRNGRYEVEFIPSENSAKLVSDTDREPIRTKKGECFEELVIKLYVPEEFDFSNPQRITRPATNTPAASTNK